MKKNILLTLLICSIGAYAAGISGVSKGDYHFGYISASAGYSSLGQNVSDVTTKGGFANMFGAGYEFRMKNGWCSVGIQYAQLKSTTVPTEYQYIPCDALGRPIGGVDDQMKPISGSETVPEKVEYYRYTIRQTDKQDWRSIDIPLMAGYYNSGFYIGAGMKVGFSVGSTITTGGSYDLAAKYEKYVGIIESNPEFTHHIYHTYEVPAKKYDCKLRPQFALLGEVGYDLLSSLQTNSKICHMLNIGFYCELGLHNVRPDDSIEPVQDQYITPYYLSKATANKHIAPYYVGLKLTYMIGGSWSSTGTWHKGCQCYGN